MKPLFPEISVNGRVIPAAAISAEAQMHPAPPGKPGLAWQAAARALVLREAMLDAARERGIVPCPAETAPGLVETDDESLVRQLIEQEVRPETIAENELRLAYAAHPERFCSPPLWEVSHILYPADPQDAEGRAAASRRAGETVEALRRDPARWAGEVAFSGCPSAKNAGRLGQIGPGETEPAFEAALRRMAAGEIAGPVETRHGVHVLRLDAVAPGAVLPFEAVRDRLRTAAEKSAWVRASRRFAAAVLAGAQVVGLPQKEGEAA